MQCVSALFEMKQIIFPAARYSKADMSSAFFAAFTIMFLPPVQARLYQSQPVLTSRPPEQAVVH